MTAFTVPGRRWRLLLGGAMLSLAAVHVEGATIAPQDFGAIDAATPIHATLWLQPHDQAGLDAAMAARTEPGAPLYHRWMTAAEMAARAASPADVDALAGALLGYGLAVTARAADRSSVSVSGSAAAMQAAFGPELHMYERDGVRSYAPAGRPAFRGGHAALIAGITGLDSVRMTPYVRRPPGIGIGIGIGTGIGIGIGTVIGPGPRGAAPGTTGPAAVVNPDALYTTSCFKADQTLSIDKFGIGGATLGVYAGPQYTATGVEPGGKLCGYTPAQVARHYHLVAAAAKGLTGKGQTIVLVEAYGSPSILADANAFAAKFGLPALDASNFSVVRPDGQSATDPYSTDWPLETSLDVEWAHAIAPGARLVLVEAPSDDPTEIVYALHYAVSHNLGSIISNSYGYPEVAYGSVVAQAFNAVFRQAAAQGIAVNVATGDRGDLGLGTPFGAASIPADSPYATAVGGTSLDVPGDNGPVDSAWGTTVTQLASINSVFNPPGLEGFREGGGGGESNIFAIPKWQSRAGLPGAGRQLPDISAIADPLTGGIIVAPNYNGTASVLTVIGGTSLSSPVFSGIWALAQQAAGARLGQAAPIIATMPSSAVTDILPVPAAQSNLTATITHAGTTVSYDAPDLLGLGSTQTNGFVGTSAVFLLQYTYDIGFGADASLAATYGWDTATGWGSPYGLAFINAAAKAAAPDR